MASLPVLIYEIYEVDSVGRSFCKRSAMTPTIEYYEVSDPLTINSTEEAKNLAVAHYESLGRTVHESTAYPLALDIDMGPQVTVYLIKE